jgi:hypothetical protein
VAKNAEEAFKVFLSWLAPRPEELARAAGHRDEIRHKLERKFGVNGMYEGGSLAHDTAVHQVSGADYFVWLDIKRPDSSMHTLKSVQKTLQSLYPAVHVRISRPAVLVEFAGGTERVGVIPSFSPGRSVGENHRFRVPGIAAEWMSASPAAHGDWLDRCNNIPGVRGGAKSLARLARAWKHYRDVPISSFYLEMRAAEYMAGRSSVVLPYDVRNFFSTLLWDGLSPMEDPTGLAETIEATPSGLREEGMSKIANAAGWSESALKHQRMGDLSQAFEQWNHVFGGRFPSWH